MTTLPRLAVPALALGLLGMTAPPAVADQGGSATESITETAPAPSSAPGIAVAGAGVLAVVGSAVVARRRGDGAR